MHYMDKRRIDINWHVYVLYSSQTNTYYHGITTRPDIRIREHRIGKTPSTRYTRDWVYYDLSYVGDYETAITLESYMRAHDNHWVDLVDLQQARKYRKYRK